jgi:methylthioxylose transferase
MTDTRRVVGALAGWVALLVAARCVGLLVAARSDDDLKLDAIPLYGHWSWVLGPRVLIPLAVGALAVWMLPRLARARSWRSVLGAVAVASVAWSLALAVVDPWPDGWTDIDHAYGRHRGLVDEAGGPAAFLSGYVDRQPTYPIHLQAHPPGLPLILWGLDRVGLGGAAVQVGLAMAAVAVAAVAALIVLRDVAGEDAARAAAPFVVLVPAAVWHTNADVIVAAVALAGVALATSGSSRPGRGVAGGLLLGGAVMLTYGAALFAIPVVAILAFRRAWPVLVVVGVTAVATVLAFLGGGFWWLDGLVTTGERYAAGVAAVRGYGYFLLANPAVFALMLGPAVVAALAVLRDRRTWVVVGSGLAMVVAATLSGLSSGEVERIWQPFVPLAALAGGALVGRSVGHARSWLAAQVVVAVVLQAALRSPW